MKIIGIAGKKRSGKSSFARALFENHVNVEIIAFANPVYAAIEAIIGEIDDELKEAPIEWLANITPRRMLQTLGTEWGRAMHPDLWVLCMRNKLEAIRQAEHERSEPVIVIPDVRFENEVAMIREFGGVMVHVVRPGADNTDTHASEAGVQVAEEDYTAYNAEDLRFWKQTAERLYQQVVHGGQAG